MNVLVTNIVATSIVCHWMIIRKVKNQGKCVLIECRTSHVNRHLSVTVETVSKLLRSRHVKIENLKNNSVIIVSNVIVIIAEDINLLHLSRKSSYC